MYNVDLNDKSVELFGESSKEIKKKDIVIIDIRVNTGGDDTAPRLWFENLTNKQPNSSGTFIRYNSLLNNNLIKDIFIGNRDNSDDKNPIIKHYDYLLSEASENENKWSIVQLKNNKTYKNDTKIFVLIDGQVASSGETFCKLIGFYRKCSICWYKYKWS